MAVCLTFAYSQALIPRGEATKVVNALDLSTISGTDTTIYARFPVQLSPDWSTLISYASVVGSGTVAVVVTWDYSGAIALFAAVMTIVTSMMGIGKKQENDRVKLERNGTGS